MIVIETCPKCGRDLETVMIATYPPIPKKMCMRCGWCWEGKKEEVVRIPFKDPIEEVYDKHCDTAGNYDIYNAPTVIPADKDGET